MVREIIHNEDDINTTVALAITWGLPSICQVEGCENVTAASTSTLCSAQEKK